VNTKPKPNLSELIQSGSVFSGGFMLNKEKEKVKQKALLEEAIEFERNNRKVKSK